MADTWGFQMDLPYNVGDSLFYDPFLPIGPPEPAHGFFLLKPQKAGGMLAKSWINLARWVPGLKGRARVKEVSLITNCRCHICESSEFVPREWHEARDRGYTAKIEWEALGEVMYSVDKRELEVWGEPRDTRYGIPVRRG